MDESSKALLTVSGLLFGFLFTAFWWILNRDLRFKPENRHFKPATGMLITSLVLLGVFGIVAPLKQAAKANPALLWSYRGVLLALLSVLGYMLTDLGHYHIYQRPKYTTNSAWVFFSLTILVILAFVLKWSFFRR
jgi:hypothetical protein